LATVPSTPSPRRVGLLVQQQDRERLRADQVDDDLLDDLDDFAEVEGGVELVAGHVEVGQVVVLLLDLDVAVGEVFVLFLDLAETLLDAAVLVGQVRDLLAQTLHFVGRTGGRFVLQGEEAVAEALVFAEELLREFLTLVEDLEKLLGF
jgi:hypothetical protein